MMFPWLKERWLTFRKWFREKPEVSVEDEIIHLAHGSFIIPLGTPDDGYSCVPDTLYPEMRKASRAHDYAYANDFLVIGVDGKPVIWNRRMADQALFDLMIDGARQVRRRLYAELMFGQHSDSTEEEIREYVDREYVSLIKRACRYYWGVRRFGWVAYRITKMRRWFKAMGRKG